MIFSAEKTASRVIRALLSGKEVLRVNGEQVEYVSLSQIEQPCTVFYVRTDEKAGHVKINTATLAAAMRKERGL